LAHAEVANVTRDSVTTFKVIKSKALQGRHIVAASRTACYTRKAHTWLSYIYDAYTRSAVKTTSEIGSNSSSSSSRVDGCGSDAQ